MKLYVTLNDGTKKYISSTAKTRRQLALSIGGEYFDLDNQFFSVNEVIAETDTDRTAAGMATGGVLGAGGGIGGVLLGGLIGGIIGNRVGQDDQARAAEFNNSQFSGTSNAC